MENKFYKSFMVFDDLKNPGSFCLLLKTSVNGVGSSVVINISNVDAERINRILKEYDNNVKVVLKNGK